MARIPTEGAPASPLGDTFASEAAKFIGDPYVYGATGPNTFDCSGLVQYVARQVGLSVPRTSQEQYTYTQRITVDELEPGDLVFSAGSDGTATSPGHVAIYVGDGQVIAAPHTGANVRTQTLQSLAPTGYGRIPGITGAGGGTGAATGAGLLGTQLPGGLGDVLGGVGGAVSNASDWFDFVKAFFQPSTYLRVGAGVAGIISLVVGFVFLARAVKGGNTE